MGIITLRKYSPQNALYTVYTGIHCALHAAPHLCAMADSLCFFFQMQQIAMVTVVRTTISATIAAIVATSRLIFTAVIVGSGVLTGTETQRGAQ